MDHAARLVERFFSAPNGELLIGRLPVSVLTGEYGTPLFIYDRGILDKKWRLLRETLPPEFSVSYSVKANPNRTILQAFLEKGAGLEIASGGEFCQALSAGCPPEKILFAGPGKTAAELELVLGKGIGEIHVESVREAECIDTIAKRLGRRAAVALRVNPAGEAEGGAMRMGGRSAPFGVDEETLDEVLDRCLSFTALDFRGIHLFTGTQILDFQILISQYAKGLEIARRVASRLKKPLRTLDFGGGLGIPYFHHEQELDMHGLKEGLETLMETAHHDTLFSGTQFLVEPGR